MRIIFSCNFAFYENWGKLLKCWLSFVWKVSYLPKTSLLICLSSYRKNLQAFNNTIEMLDSLWDISELKPSFFLKPSIRRHWGLWWSWRIFWVRMVIELGSAKTYFVNSFHLQLSPKTVLHSLEGCWNQQKHRN